MELQAAVLQLTASNLEDLLILDESLSMSQQWREDKQPAGWLMLCLPRRNFKAWFSLTKSVEEIWSDPVWSCSSNSVSWVEMQSLPSCTMESALTSGLSPLARLSAFISASSLPTRLPRSPWHTALSQCVFAYLCQAAHKNLHYRYSYLLSEPVIAQSLLIPFFILFLLRIMDSLFSVQLFSFCCVSSCSPQMSWHA